MKSDDPSFLQDLTNNSPIWLAFVPESAQSLLMDHTMTTVYWYGVWSMSWHRGGRSWWLVNIFLNQPRPWHACSLANILKILLGPPPIARWSRSSCFCRLIVLLVVYLWDTVTLRLMLHGVVFDFQSNLSVLNEYWFNTSQTTSFRLPRRFCPCSYDLFSLYRCWGMAIDHRTPWLLWASVSNKWQSFFKKNLFRLSSWGNK
jgi:hypothetical protein